MAGSTENGGEGSYFLGGVIILVIGFAFVLAAWLGYLSGEALPVTGGVALVGAPLVLLGTYVSMLGAAKIES